MVMKEIFCYVRNDVAYEPYLGVMAGPNWTLLQGAGNSFDQALLLSSLLRESGIQTRYVYGKIVPLDPSFKLYDYVAGLESPLLNLASTSNLLYEYFYESDYLSNVMSCPSISWYRPSPSQVITSLNVVLGTWCYENGTIAKIVLEPEGMSIDFTHETIFAVGTAGDREEKAFMLSKGMLGSCLEHEFFEQLYKIESVSTMKILELANNHDIRIYTIIEDGVYIEKIYNETTYTNCLGNYWDDYKRTDAGGDGICDIPYRVDDDKDYYPFMEQFEDYNILAPTNVVIWDAHYDAGGGIEHEG